MPRNRSGRWIASWMTHRYNVLRISEVATGKTRQLYTKYIWSWTFLEKILDTDIKEQKGLGAKRLSTEFWTALPVNTWHTRYIQIILNIYLVLPIFTWVFPFWDCLYLYITSLREILLFTSLCHFFIWDSVFTCQIYIQHKNMFSLLTHYLLNGL